MLKNKLMAIIFMLLMLIPTVCFAEYTVSSDSRDYSIINGTYELQGNVIVQFPVRGENMRITADWARVQMWQQELHSGGNVNLEWGALSFNCENVDVYHSERTAYLSGDLRFNCNGNYVTSDEGSYCWKTKLATFSGNVVVNGISKDDTVIYSFRTNTFQ